MVVLQEADLVDCLSKVQTELVGLVGMTSWQVRCEVTLRLKAQSDFYPKNQEWLMQGHGEEGRAEANTKISWP